jgi:hypothetical protein
MIRTATVSHTNRVILVNHGPSPATGGRKKSSTPGGNGTSLLGRAITCSRTACPSTASLPPPTRYTPIRYKPMRRTTR